MSVIFKNNTSYTREGVTLIRVGSRNSKVVQTRQSSEIKAAAETSSPQTTSISASSQETVAAQDRSVVDAKVLVYDATDTEFDKMAGIGDLVLAGPAPQFEAQAVVNGEFKTIKLSDYKGKYVVLFFYPLDFTFVCPTEIIAFSEHAKEFRDINCEVLACSTDSVFSHLAWVNTPRKQGGLGQMNIPLLADKNAEISKKYGCLKPGDGIAFRGLYIIDDKQNLRQITINDLPVGRSVEETLRLVQAFQFTDKHGEVCPAGWRPGKDTIKPDPKGIQEYLSKEN
ncbi:peroxiredoxin 1-like isoform X1 [Biomphalaria glabrata]|uniref:Thioredoxin peroxidase n=2 Tax=Biomphalaria glabrata TaxID=6526 RepID=A0A9W3AF43_BIOGL|nr:peroxiredoxin 1-like isoform X1 [Biomphalaria glabrata]